MRKIPIFGAGQFTVSNYFYHLTEYWCSFIACSHHTFADCTHCMTGRQTDSPLVLASPLAHNHHGNGSVQRFLCNRCTTRHCQFHIRLNMDSRPQLSCSCYFKFRRECHEVRFVANCVRQQPLLVNACSTACYIPSRNFVTDHCEVKIIINGKTDIWSLWT